MSNMRTIVQPTFGVCRAGPLWKLDVKICSLMSHLFQANRDIAQCILSFPSDQSFSHFVSF